MGSKKEKAMSLASRMTNVVSGIQHQTEDLSGRVEDAKDALAHCGHRAQRFVRKNRTTAIVGAFVLGFALAKLARHA